MMNIIAMIPARYAATRFPYKLMQPLGNKTVIRSTYDNTVATNLFNEVFVVTDHEIIFNEIISHGGKAIMSKATHESGSDRIAEAVENMPADVVINVQGDEPFVHFSVLKSMIGIFKDDAENKVQVVSPMKTFTDLSLIANPNFVKVAVDKNNNALLFSRSVIPYWRDEKVQPIYFEHIGIYGFRKDALLQFTRWKPTPLETAEKLEQLRYLENAVSIKMFLTDMESVKIDVPEDLVKAEQYLKSFQQHNV